MALRVPLRLLDMMRSLLRQPKDTQWPDASAAAAAKLPAAAASSLSDSDDLEAEAAAATAAEAVAEADSLSEADLTSAVRLAGIEQFHLSTAPATQSAAGCCIVSAAIVRVLQDRDIASKGRHSGWG